MSETFSEPQITELGSRRLWIQLLRSRLLEEASAGFEPEADEVANAWASFCKRNQLDPENPAKVPPEFMGCPPALLQSVVEREVRIAKWKKALFEPQAAEHFERRKPALDRVVYSLLRVKEAGLARELWFRIKEGEATFAELAPDYASGNEVYTAGIVGPVTFGAMHPALAGVLKSARAGELLKPFAVAEWFLVARVDHQLPAEFDEAMKQQMIEELAAQWLQERTHGRPTA
jgi:parvulin-like peptidyl-prolyl isomerase